MTDCPQFQLMPQVVPIFRPQLPPPPPNAFPMQPGQPMFPIPTHFGFPPMTWSPIHHFPPPPTPPLNAYNNRQQHAEEEHEYNAQPQLEQPAYNNNNNGPSNDSLQNDPSNLSPRSARQAYTRNVSNKSDTRHEEFRKYLEENGILSTFTNILAEMYQDPLRPNDPLGYIRDKLNCSRPEIVELSNLRLWCDQYQTRTVRLEKELKHVIEQLRKYEPYNTDDSLFNECSTENDCKSCVLDVTKLGHVESKEENSNHELIKNKNQ
ncbi:uncharacterized protein LOC112688323 isoform X2 [Sipha flava]|nr:uncharacterized protein LOC112688323 isoform X2 [Sipha flava]XP_025417261.1 uncharacterized protein LOC112688323 isoform X2 [Sipha flava]